MISGWLEISVGDALCESVNQHLTSSQWTEMKNSEDGCYWMHITFPHHKDKNLLSQAILSEDHT